MAFFFCAGSLAPPPQQPPYLLQLTTFLHQQRQVLVQQGPLLGLKAELDDLDKDTLGRRQVGHLTLFFFGWVCVGGGYFPAQAPPASVPCASASPGPAAARDPRAACRSANWGGVISLFILSVWYLCKLHSRRQLCVHDVRQVRLLLAVLDRVKHKVVDLFGGRAHSG